MIASRSSTSVFDLDPAKLVVIAVVAIMVLGPKKLPQFARSVGGAWRAFHEFRQRMESELRTSLPDLPSTTELATYARSPSAVLERLSSSLSQDHAVAPTNGTTPLHSELTRHLPPIADGAEPHWTTISYEQSAGPTTRQGRPEFHESLAGDATLN